MSARSPTVNDDHQPYKVDQGGPATTTRRTSSGKNIPSCLPVPAMSECIQMHHIGDRWAVSCTQEGKTGVTVYGCMYTTSNELVDFDIEGNSVPTTSYLQEMDDI
ncbi:hypothetical protein Bbelb_051070 [Branchiostoma belcheri]|nr:hypothetical protein Bbelb_051070 [Branchiostoma belcheri]